MVIVSLVGIKNVGKKLLFNIKPTKIASITIVTSLVISSLIGIAIIIIGDVGTIEMKILGTTAILGGCSLLCLPSLFNLERYRYKMFTAPGMLFSIVFFGLLLFLMWSENTLDGEYFLKSIFTIGVIAFAINHSLLLMMIKPMKTLVDRAQKATIGVLSVVAVLILLSVWSNEFPEPLVRLLISFIILDVLGTISLPILNKLR